MSRIEIKEDFDELFYALQYNHDTRTFPKNPKKLADQIISDQEKAKNWDSIVDISNKYGIVSPLQLALDYNEIVNRLKESIKECENEICCTRLEEIQNKAVLQELQKILKGDA